MRSGVAGGWDRWDENALYRAKVHGAARVVGWREGQESEITGTEETSKGKQKLIAIWAYPKWGHVRERVAREETETREVASLTGNLLFSMRLTGHCSDRSSLDNAQRKGCRASSQPLYLWGGETVACRGGSASLQKAREERIAVDA